MGSPGVPSWFSFSSYLLGMVAGGDWMYSTYNQDLHQGLGKRIHEIRKTEKRHTQGRVDSKKEGQ